MICPECGGVGVAVSYGYVRGNPAKIERCEKSHKFGKTWEHPQYQFLQGADRSAKRDEYTGSLKGYGYYGDLIKSYWEGLK